ncbi:MAG: lipoprotein N-acyltransferase Lnb domain-containing protein [Luteibaculaceae bacterium]
MIKKYGLFVLTAFLVAINSTYLQAKPLQNENMFKYEYIDFEESSISLLTCGPGNELYSIFGHTAIRVKDPVLNIDAVFNFGTFEFDENFYKNYVMGRLNYCLSYSSFDDFMYAYQREGREVRELKFNLDIIQKQAFFHWLRRTYLGPDRCYLYDFLYDNCTTKLRDHTDSWPFPYKNINLPDDTVRVSFRNLIHQNLTYFPWSGLGIDILLGLPIDKKPDYRLKAFLPDILEAYYLNKHIKNIPFTEPEPTVLLNEKINWPNQTRFLYHPVTIFLLIFLPLIAFKTFKPQARITKISSNLIFPVLGALGFFLLFMWFGTDHPSTKNNLNLVWANPLFLFYPFVKKQKLWINVLAWFMLIGGSFAALGFIISPQGFNLALTPLFIWIALQGFTLLKSNQ